MTDYLSLLEQPVPLLTIAIVLSLLLPATRMQQWLTQSLQTLGLRLNGARYSARYLKVAGGAVLLCLLLPLVATYWALSVLAPSPSLLEPLLLWCCLDLGRLSRTLPSCLQPHERQKEMARLALAPLCLRQTDPLSPLGLYKAMAEMTTLRLAADAALLCWYVWGGVYAALIFALLRYGAQAWPFKIEQWRAFGTVASWLYRAMAWLPFQLLALTLLIYPGSMRAIKAWPQGKLWAYPASGRLLAVAAAGMNIGLGGPRRYTDATTYYPKLGTKNYLNGSATRALFIRIIMALLFWLSLGWAFTLVMLFNV
ncbi:cobalamin biosynthesis protein [Oceanisphaera pacifica]|uniref:Cobalamin biosynthesis protein n=1 Tax=Oceanisphaera pacifica TaxID=2818389 RepID=A0ABS3NIE8_9GAMM|nr:cobalamin biosynthesis protein [Oceanisphaera pacifica]MBO1520359.1 cobalamin biosynthesis protein [Oceanisphaera pacifica]